MLQVITPTGDRPFAWSLCQKWMQRQTYAGPVVWHVTDDGVTESLVDFSREGYELRMHRLAPMNGNSQARNLLYLLKQIDPAYPVVCFEDDDWYSPEWLEVVARELSRAELVGEFMARYYNISSRVGRQLNNSAHASLCSTAMRGRAIATFKRACEANPKFIDLELWRLHRDRHLFGGHRVVGIKGLPGRGGIGMGHSKNFNGTPDPDLRILREWIGEDAEAYQ